MSIAILMYTVVIKLEAINEKYPGGIEEYSKTPYVWHDHYLVGSSFMNGFDVESHINYLKKYGIVFDAKQYSSDIAIVDQIRGILTSCDWLEFGEDDKSESICWLMATMPGRTVVPKEFYDKS